MRSIEEIKSNTRLALTTAEREYGDGTFLLHDRKHFASVIYSLENHEGKEVFHVSISPFGKRMPTWDDMCDLKDAFFEDEERAYQIHPKKSEYVNVSENCLHLWSAVQ